MILSSKPAFCSTRQKNETTPGGRSKKYNRNHERWFYPAGSKVKAVCMNSMGTNPQENTDNASILLKYENGSNAVINYFANGSKAYSKERIEAYNQEKTLIIDNWRTLKGYGTKGFSKLKTRLDKGHKNQFKLLVESIKTGYPIIPFDEIVNTTKASFAAIQSLKEGRWVDV